MIKSNYIDPLLKIIDNQLCLTKIICKNFQLSDYSKTENLVEYENKTTGNKIWFELSHIFLRNILLGKTFEISKIKNGKLVKEKKTVSQIKEHSYKNRDYLIAVLK